MFGRRAAYRQKVLGQLYYTVGRTSFQIHESLGLWSSVSRLYVALAELENSGQIYSDWVPGTYPRKRIYFLDQRKDV